MNLKPTVFRWFFLAGFVVLFVILIAIDIANHQSDVLAGDRKMLLMFVVLVIILFRIEKPVWDIIHTRKERRLNEESKKSINKRHWFLVEQSQNIFSLSIPHARQDFLSSQRLFITSTQGLVDQKLSSLAKSYNSACEEQAKLGGSKKRYDGSNSFVEEHLGATAKVETAKNEFWESPPP